MRMLGSLTLEEWPIATEEQRDMAIVRLDRIDTLLRSSGGDYAVRLKDGTELSVSRARRDELEQRLGVQ